MKVLDFEAVRAIAAETPDSELIRWVDEALREKSGYTLPPKIHIAQQDGDYYNVMPCIYEQVTNMLIPSRFWTSSKLCTHKSTS